MKEYLEASFSKFIFNLTMKHLLLFFKSVCSAFDYERIAGQNRGIFNRNSAWDGTRTLPSKVQFGASIAYSPPE